MRNLQVGLAVLFFSGAAYANSRGIAGSGNDFPMAATVAHVHSDNMVNLAVLDRNGASFSVTSVPIYPDSAAIPPLQDGGFYATWLADDIGVTERQHLRVELVRDLIKQGSSPHEIERHLRYVEKAIFVDDVKPIQQQVDIQKTDSTENIGTSLTFGEALAALKSGHKVARAGWNGKDMWLSISRPEPFTIPAENFWSPHNRRYAEQNGGKATVLPSITMKIATGEILMGWLASQTDMLAEDWAIVE